MNVGFKASLMQTILNVFTDASLFLLYTTGRKQEKQLQLHISTPRGNMEHEELIHDFQMTNHIDQLPCFTVQTSTEEAPIVSTRTAVLPAQGEKDHLRRR